jgi:enoyl-CoA hydratase/carnithine racemase
MKDNSLKVPPRDFVPFLERTHFVTKPVIAAVNGLAYAGGWFLAQMCDLCIASENSKFAITEVKVGRGVPWSAPLVWMIPTRIMMEILLTGEPISAQRAYEIGFVNKVVPLESLLSTAKEMAGKIVANAPLTVKASKRMVYQSMEMGRTAALNVADIIFEPVYFSEDAQEGPRAFAEKRKPLWRNQ